jgi:glycerophosphoryl diester phosphodiesterase
VQDKLLFLHKVEKMRNTRPMILGHRGYSAQFPENSKLSFQEAWKYCDGIECDIQKSLDGEFVVIHDATTGRTAETSLQVNARTLDTLKSVRFDGEQVILTLVELLDLAPGNSIINIELKHETITPVDCPAIIDLIHRHGSHLTVIVSSFEPDLLHGFRREGIQTGLLLGEDNRDNSIMNVLCIVTRIKPVFCNLPVQMFERLGIRKARLICRLLSLLVKGLIFWTVNSEIEYNRVSKFAKMIITNEVELLVSLQSKDKKRGMGHD